MYLDAHFVTGSRKVSGARLANQPTRLLASLVEQDDARLRLGIIPLLLRHPTLAVFVPEAVRRVAPRRRKLLKLYYTAAVMLQQKYASRLEPLLGAVIPLSDWYSEELGIPANGTPETRLRKLARKHREWSGLALNWLGTYEHAAERLVQHLETTRSRHAEYRRG